MLLLVFLLAPYPVQTNGLVETLETPIKTTRSSSKGYGQRWISLALKPPTISQSNLNFVDNPLHLILLHRPHPSPALHRIVPDSSGLLPHVALLPQVTAVECSARARSPQQRCAAPELLPVRPTVFHGEVQPTARRPAVRPVRCSRHGVRPSPARACPGVRRSCPFRRCCPQLGSCP